MCGHGTIGLAVTLAHLGRIGPGRHHIETPAGMVKIQLQDANTVAVTNVESRVVARDLTVKTAALGAVTGTIAYGGNWFFIVDPSPIPVNQGNISQLTDAAKSIRAAVNARAFEDGKNLTVDHIVLQGNSENEGVFGRNFVLCPDDTYDRSPCGTGTSAYIASLADRKILPPGQDIVIESIIGSRYRLSYQHGAKAGIIPTITGQAFVMAESILIFDEQDPFRTGIPV